LKTLTGKNTRHTGTLAWLSLTSASRCTIPSAFNTYSTAAARWIVEAAREKARAGLTDEDLRSMAEELIREAGAFPDNSIISGYQAGPILQKLPDYIVARAIEEIIAPEKSE